MENGLTDKEESVINKRPEKEVPCEQRINDMIGFDFQD